MLLLLESSSSSANALGVAGSSMCFIYTECLDSERKYYRKTSSSLAITERKTQRPGGCIGIFFQLFDWNRRLAKKKLFSKKLLPAARAKQASKKFKGDEKMPNSKLYLIANENIGGFPSGMKIGNREVDVEQKHEMQIPGLVARLMGLEVIPASQRDKSNKASFPNTCEDREKESLDNHFTRFGAESLQIKSVLSQPRKHHHPKLASPFKTPKITSGKKISRNSKLIGAATKILEPGLQATSRAKCSIAYSGTMYHPKTVDVIEGMGTKSAGNQSSYDASLAKPLNGQTSCNNCGNLLDVGCRGNIEGQPVIPPHIVVNMSNDSSMVSAQRKARSLVSSHEQEGDVVVLMNQERLLSLVAEEEGKNETQSGNKPTTRSMPLPSEVTTAGNSSHQLCRTQQDDASSVAFKTQTQEHTLIGERISPRSNVRNLHVKRVSSAANNVNGTKDFVALNRSLSGRTRLRSPTKLDNSKLDLERKACNRQDDSLSRGRLVERKRRSPNVTHVENTVSVNSTTVKQINLCSNPQGGKRRENTASTRNITNVKSKRCHQGIPTEKEETSSDNQINTFSPKSLPLKGDVLGALLEQKLKELTSQEDEELATGAPPKKSTAMILQELIFALSAEHLNCHDGHMVNTDIGSHCPSGLEYFLPWMDVSMSCVYHVELAENGEVERCDRWREDGTKKDSLPGASCDGNHPSPGSVLEASFSSSSLDESSGHGLQLDSMNYSYDQLAHMEYDCELSDSATSFNKVKLGREALTDLVSQIIPRVVHSVDSSGSRLTRCRLTHVKDVILNAELLLGNTTMHNEVVPHASIVSFLVDELDTIADFEGFVGCEDFKERKQLKGFLFDCVIEYLESICCRYCNCGFEAWNELSLWMKSEMLIIQGVKKEIKKWASMAGMIPDEIIEWEMSHSLGKWTDFDIEAFEAGAAIDGDILGFLVDEIVEDLIDSPRSCS
ncbi:hypothetical protein G2W53_025437 [Senna tora]|uniref:DUF4378 domain-containing protein n=1 Tax=Senna tora TaxID=362788 RepID=A0A834WES0_9FABA|nr:hypothetical protein G2W53_025437 [Senna tora]